MAATTALAGTNPAGELQGHSFVPRLEALEDRKLPSTLTVLNLNDSGPGSLRAEVAAAHSGDTIVFKHGLSGTIALTSGELLVTTSVTINGPGADKLSVSGHHASRVFETVAGQTVSINGLTVRDGHGPDQGGGILNDGSNLTLSGDVLSQNVAFEGITTAARGGALMSLGGTLTITDCQITGNQALGGSGASAFGDASGGGIDVLAGDTTISNSTLSGNQALSGDNSSDGFAGGGGIYFGDPAVGTELLISTSITDSTISDNLVRAGANTPNYGVYGGGLFTWVTTTITGSTFSGNQAVGGLGGTGEFVGVAEGGGINDYGDVVVRGSVFEQNQAIGGSDGTSGPGTPGPFVDYGFGGAICNTQSILNVTSSTFSHNQALGGNNATAVGTDIIGVGGAEGGAIFNELAATGSISDSTLDHNQAEGGNGNSGSGQVALVGEGLGGAIAAGYGGNFYGPTTLTVTDSTLTHNDATGGDNNTGTASMSGLVGAGVGAGIAQYVGGTVSVSGGELDHNQASGGHHNTAGGAGAVFAGLGAGGGIFNYLSNFNSSVYGNLGVSVVNVSGCVIDHNQAQGSDGGNGEGGGIANLLLATTTVTGSTITQNEANGGGGGAGLGGGAFNDGSSSLALTDSSVTQNHANGSPGIGGGVYTRGAFSHDAATVIADNHASTGDDNIGP